MYLRTRGGWRGGLELASVIDLQHEFDQCLDRAVDPAGEESSPRSTNDSNRLPPPFQRCCLRIVITVIPLAMRLINLCESCCLLRGG